MIRRGSITVESSTSGDVILRNLHDSIRIERADLDDAIEALCVLRQQLDPLWYQEQLLPRLTPRVVATYQETDTDGEETDFEIGEPPPDGWKRFVPDPPMAEQVKRKK